MSDVKLERTQNLERNQYRKPLPGTHLEYFDACEAIESISPGAYKTLPYTSRVLAEQLVRRCDPETLEDSLKPHPQTRTRKIHLQWFTVIPKL